MVCWWKAVFEISLFYFLLCIILDEQLFCLIFLKIWFHCLLISVVVENMAVRLILGRYSVSSLVSSLVLVWCGFFLDAFYMWIFFLINILPVFFFFLNPWMPSFHQVRRILSHYLFEYCFFPVLSTSSRILIRHLLVLIQSSKTLSYTPFHIYFLSCCFCLFWTVFSDLSFPFFLFWRSSVFPPNLPGLFWLFIALCSYFLFLLLIL